MGSSGWKNRRVARQVLGTIILIGAMVSQVAVAAAPNFIIMIGDDVAWNDHGSYGHPHIQTPHTDQLAREGMRFDAAFLSISSCSPSRCSIMTGRYPHSTGAGELHQPLPASQVMFPGLLKKRGYYTAAAGKWHLGNTAKAAFDRIEGGRPSGCEKWVTVLKERPRDKPFFLWLAASDAHRDYQAGAIPRPHKNKDVIVPPYLPDVPDTRKDLALYYDEVSRLDSYVGKVMAELRKQGVDKNTFVLYMSDNGRPFPRCKTTIYDSGVKTPFIVRWPARVKAGSINANLVSSVDIASTIMELAGGKSATFQGKSFVPTLDDVTRKVRDHVFSEHNWHDYSAHERSARDTRYLYIRNSYPQFPGTPPADAVRSLTYRAMLKMNPAGTLNADQQGCFIKPRPREELYDTQADPHCLKNIAASSSHQAILKRLQGELDQWVKRTSDVVADAIRPDGFHRQTGARLKKKAAVLQAIPPVARRIPPAGIKLDQDQRSALARQLKEIQQQLADFQASHGARGPGAWSADVEVFTKAVALALAHGEFYSPKDGAKAEKALKHARERLQQLEKNKHPWTSQTGLVVRGYVSSIDDSVQPYGLEIPVDLPAGKRVPLYVWLHGRGDKTTDLHFVDQRQNRAGKVVPPGAIVLHPFGRHCMGFKSAGEIDVLEATRHVLKNYPIDPERVVLMGFSMGGAGAWHVGAHYADQWVAMSPGAGFAETAQYNKMKPENYPPAYVQQLWGLYDVPNYVRNLFNIPVVAYSGEVDKQIQAARVMEKAFLDQGRTLPHIIGPKMGHRYHPDSLKEIMKRMGQAVQDGSPRLRREVHLQTRTLRYSRQYWVQVTGLKRHWVDTRVDAVLQEGDKQLDVKTRNVTRLQLTPGVATGDLLVQVDGQQLQAPAGVTKTIYLENNGGKWAWSAREAAATGLRKKPGLQGPIDDVFYERFLVVTPSGKSSHPAVQRWVDFELQHFQQRWRALYRGELRVKSDREVSVEDFQDNHVILWGDPSSNRWIRALGDGSQELAVGGSRKSFRWNNKNVSWNGKDYPASHHVPVLVYPSPWSPNKYVVLNSGPTHREGHDRTNSLQNPKLPDWSIVDLRQLPDALLPGKIVANGFFDESWKTK